MRDVQVMVACVGVGLCALVLSLLVPPRVDAGDLMINGTVVSVFTPSGLTIAHVRLHSTVPVVFLRGANVSRGELLVVNASLARYGGGVELVVK